MAHRVRTGQSGGQWPPRVAQGSENLVRVIASSNFKDFGTPGSQTHGPRGIELTRWSTQFFSPLTQLTFF